MHSSRMHNTYLSGCLSCIHAPLPCRSPLACTSSPRMPPCHTCPLPCMPPAIHTPCHAYPCHNPFHSCHPPLMPPTMHIPTMHAPMPCMATAMHAHHQACPPTTMHASSATYAHPVHRQTPLKNIIFPQLLLRGGRGEGVTRHNAIILKFFNSLSLVILSFHLRTEPHLASN